MTRLDGRVLVASDLGRRSDQAIRDAAALALSARVPLVACHALPELFGFRPLFPHLRELDRAETDRVRELAARALEEQITRVLEPGSARPELRLEAGSPHAVVLEVAAGIAAGVIVLGREPEGGSRSIPERVARHASCPVLTVAERRGRAVLAATDFSDPALPAIHWGREEAERRGLPLVVVHAVDLHTSRLELPEIVSQSLIQRVTETRRGEARARLDELAGRLGPEVRLELREGPAVDAILAVAEAVEAELVVIGTRGRTGLARLALGSVAEGVLRRAPCSTLVVRLEA